MKSVLLALALIAGFSATTTLAAEAKKPDVTIPSDTLNKATAASLQKQGADQILGAIDKASRFGIVVEVPDKKVPPLVIVPTDTEWPQLMEFAKKIAADRRARAEGVLKDLGVTVTP